MSEADSEHEQLKQLNIQLQHLRVLLEDATIRGAHHRVQQLLNDIKSVEDQINAIKK